MRCQISEYRKAIGRRISAIQEKRDDVVGHVPPDYRFIPDREKHTVSIVASLIGPVTGLLDKFVEDKDQKAQLAHEISTLSDKHAQELALAQVALNTAEAKGNWFQSSWRPATGWVCVLALAVNYLISPIAAGFGVVIPQADGGTLMPILGGLLGLGGMRSFEKTKNIEGK